MKVNLVVRWWFTILLVILNGCTQHLQHRVSPGDTLYSIGWEYGYDYHLIAQWNNLQQPYALKNGQLIKLTPPNGDYSALAERPAPVVNIGDPPPAKLAGAPRPSAGSSSATKGGTGPATALPLSDLSVKQKALPALAMSHKERVITSEKGWRWPTDGKISVNYNASDERKKGIDIAGSVGQPIHAAGSGRVVYSGNGLKGYGNLVIIKHDEAFLSAYANNSKVYVKEGDEVVLGQKIAAMGMSDRNEAALHFEIRRDGKSVDPVVYLPRR
ncbi:MAG: lipoprotein NlpD [Halothiobacillaceae bacterium]|nr:MAG: lipoprotein NlpD [Halothiobacillaceae bacterium]